MNSPHAADMLAAAEAADRAANAPSEAEQIRAVMEVFAHKESVQLALMNQHIRRVAESHRDQERLPLTVEGDAFGEVVARVPRNLFFHLAQQRNFGWDGFADSGGLKDFLKTYPQCRVKTISGKTTVGFTRPQPRRVHFGRGTLQFAT